MTDPDTKTPRVRRTPRQEAIEALQVAQAQYEKAREDYIRELVKCEGAAVTMEKAEKHLAYAKQHPNLPVKVTVFPDGIGHA